MTHMAHMDETYLHLVTSLLMEKDTLFRADRSDSMTSEDRDDFLPLVSEFLIPQRDRAFSWDVSFEEGLSGEAIQSLIAEQTKVPFYKPMLPPTSVSMKMPVNLKISAIVDEDHGMKCFGDVSSTKECLPMKKRKMGEKNENSSKKNKADKGEKILFDPATSNHFSSCDLSNRGDPGMSLGIKTLSPTPSIFTEPKISASKKNVSGVKLEDRSSQLSDSLNSSQTRLLSIPTSVSSHISKGSASATPATTSPSYMLLPQPSWNDYGVYQSADMSRTSSTLNPNMSIMNAGLPANVNLCRIPLLASDFGPANGIVIGDGCRVGVYTREERLVRIERFREKKLKRIWRKQIKYDCRKRLADTRPRVKGRFVSRIGENGEELPPEPKPDSDSLDSKKKKKKLLKGCPAPAAYEPYAQPPSHIGSESMNNGDTTQESEDGEGEDAGDSICSDGGESLSIHPDNSGGLLIQRECDSNMQLSLEDSLGHIIDIICGDGHNGELH